MYVWYFYHQAILSAHDLYICHSAGGLRLSRTFALRCNYDLEADPPLDCFSARILEIKHYTSTTPDFLVFGKYIFCSLLQAEHIQFCILLTVCSVCCPDGTIVCNVLCKCLLPIDILVYWGGIAIFAVLLFKAFYFLFFEPMDVLSLIFTYNE